MSQFIYSEDQEELINAPLSDHIFLEGVAGTGKTTAGVGRLQKLVTECVPAENILIFVPQRTLAFPYFNTIRNPIFPMGSVPDIITLGGLARRQIEFFWPLVAEKNIFARPDIAPTFLTLETAQFYLARLISPLIDAGYFEAIQIDKKRLLSQILDNLNKASVVGFDFSEISSRLRASWIGEPSQLRAFDEAQECATLFRTFCLENNLLDYSLQVEIFLKHLWPLEDCHDFLKKRYTHIIYDNVEEDVPVAHDLIRDWLPEFKSALLIYDLEGAYRAFLGADHLSGYSLKSACNISLQFSTSWITSPEMEDFRKTMQACILRDETPINLSGVDSVFKRSYQQYTPQMIDQVCSQISDLVHKHDVQPREITILSPYLSDSLRFSLENRLQNFDIPTQSHRPSRSLGDEPATNCLLTLAKLAHPAWGEKCSRHELRYTLMQSISNLDLTRADLLAQIVYRPNRFEEGLSSFDRINPDMQERISYTTGEQFEAIRKWVSDYRSDIPVELDLFISRVFSEILSQPGFGFHNNYDGAAVVTRLVESIRKFRWALLPEILNSEDSVQTPLEIGKLYLEMVKDRVIAAQYLQNWQRQSNNAVFIAPAYTFLMSNRSAAHQFWLDIGSHGWWERLYQPLTHPYVLSRQWNKQPWTDAQEYRVNQETLSRLTSGLMRRCNGTIYLCAAGINEQGSEQRGLLLQATQTLLRYLSTGKEAEIV
jgi:hypothetical protein